MEVTLDPIALKKMSQDLRFQLWWGLVHALSPETVRTLNLTLGHVFFPPDKIAWVEKKVDP